MVDQRVIASLFLFALCGCDSSPPVAISEKKPIALWVWNRSEALTEKEADHLGSSGIRTLYWQIGELTWSDGELKVLGQWPLPADTGSLRYLPVVRIDSSVTDPSELDAKELAQWARIAGATDFIQFDYDCPTRLLPAYAEMLGEFRTAFGKVELTCTALLSWANAGDLKILESKIDAIFPMFYDAYPENQQSSDRPEEALPLVEFTELRDQMKRWGENCKIPWHVGLPNFTRLSIFRNGEPKGHIRSWTIDEVFANPAIRFDGSGRPGVSLFKVLNATKIGTVPLRENDWLVFRQCAREELRRVQALLPDSPALSTVYYQMPRAGLASNGWSVAELANEFPAELPLLELRLSNDGLSLVNTTGCDIALKPDAPHVLHLRWSEPLLREIHPGDFISVETLREGKNVPPFAATEIHLTFHQLRSGESLQSGLFLLKDHEKNLEVEYRIDQGSWKLLSIEP